MGGFSCESLTVQQNIPEGAALQRQARQPRGVFLPHTQPQVLSALQPARVPFLQLEIIRHLQFTILDTFKYVFHHCFDSLGAFIMGIFVTCSLWCGCLHCVQHYRCHAQVSDPYFSPVSLYSHVCPPVPHDRGS